MQYSTSLTTRSSSGGVVPEDFASTSFAPAYAHIGERHGAAPPPREDADRAGSEGSLSAVRRSGLFPPAWTIVDQPSPAGGRVRWPGAGLIPCRGRSHSVHHLGGWSAGFTPADGSPRAATSLTYTSGAGCRFRSSIVRLLVEISLYGRDGAPSLVSIRLGHHVSLMSAMRQAPRAFRLAPSANSTLPTCAVGHCPLLPPSCAYRSPSRRCLIRVTSVHHLLGSPSLFTPRQIHEGWNHFDSIFGQPLEFDPLAIWRWKKAIRAIRHVRLDQYEDRYSEAFRRAASEPPERKLDALLARRVKLAGVEAATGFDNYPFYAPRSMPIIDVRTVEALFKAGLILTKRATLRRIPEKTYPSGSGTAHIW